MSTINEVNKMQINRCCSCGDKAVLNHHGEGYCGHWAAMGVFNLFGYCKKENKYSPELREYWKAQTKRNQLYRGY